MEDCIFCKIIKGEIPSSKVYEDEDIIAFKDIQPEAPIHILLVPKKHIKSLNEIEEKDEQLISKIFYTIKFFTNIVIIIDTFIIFALAKRKRDVAQLVARHVRDVEAAGSSPVISTI